jgi:iron(III) transport system permease protein
MIAVPFALHGRARQEPPLIVAVLAALIALSMLLPAAYLLIRVSEDWPAAWDAVSANSAQRALVRTAVLCAAVTAGTIAVAVPLAWLTERTDLPLRRIWAVVFALPLAIPSYVGAFTLVAALGPRGMLQDVLSPLGVDSLPQIYGFRGAWLALTMFTFPYVFLPVHAAIRNLDRSMEEAARGLGRSRIATFFLVTLPQLRPSIAAGAVLVALYTLSDFGAVSILRFDSLSRIIYLRYTTFDRGSAAALALLLVALTLLVVAAENALRGRGRYHAAARHAVPPRISLGRWRWPAFLLCTAVALVSLALPVTVMAYWLTRGIEAGETVSFVRSAAVNSLYVSLLAAVIAVAAALPIARLAVRYPGPFSSAIEKAAYSGYALPGITIALALVFFAANYAPRVYQTMTLLLFAYLVRFLPQAIAACRSALLQVNPHTEQAARSLGVGRWETFGRVTVPQILPGLTGGGVLVFLTVMKELPVTLLLSPIGFETLATQVWSATSEAFFARAALPALILVGLSALPMLVTAWREDVR